jgi:type II secretory pathway pseudopilin PulG
MNRREGFSLTELLTVVSISTLMVSIMLPAVSNVKTKLRSTMCTSNLQQLGQIFTMYTDDNDAKFMERGCGFGYGAVSWFHCIRSYHDPNDELIFCPLAVDTIPDGGRNPYMAWLNTTDFGAYYEGSYGINLWVANGDSCAWDPDPNGFERLCWRTPTVTGASSVPLLVCSQWKDIQPHPTDEPLEYESLLWTGGPFNEMQRPCIKRHTPYSVNVLFLDAAGDSRTIKELWLIKWHKMWPAGCDHVPVWPEWMDDVPDPCP